MKMIIVGFFIVLFLTGITVAIISCATDGGTGATSQQSQPRKAPARGG